MREWSEGTQQRDYDLKMYIMREWSEGTHQSFSYVQKQNVQFNKTSKNVQSKYVLLNAELFFLLENHKLYVEILQTFSEILRL